MSADERLHHRYPGLQPFERRQSALFYGRGEDVQRLSNLILREQLVVLFSKSGIGKTSLLQAGVAPLLERKGYLPVFLRADNTGLPITETIRQQLDRHPGIGRRDTTGQREGVAPGLWETMKRLEFDLDGLPVTPVLIFDQFEEVFTLMHREDSRREFLQELSDLVGENMPEKVRADLLDRLQQGDDQLGPDIMQWWEKEPDVRIILSIRSDFLHLLDEISPLIPGILRSRYQLQPLTRRQAREAIEAPAAAIGQYLVPPFRYSEAALQEMLAFLAGESDGEEAFESLHVFRMREEIESFNLQILCQHIEEKLIASGIHESYVVDTDFYGGYSGMEDEIRHFYRHQLEVLPATYARRTGREVEDPDNLIQTARVLIEESLVTPIGRRCSMVDDFLTATWNVSQDFLDTLVDSRLLRKEMRLDDFYYEISHDTLLPAILESRDARRRKDKADEEKARLQAQLDEEARRREAVESELATVREKRRLARRITILSVFTLLLSLVFGLWFLWNFVRSTQSELALAERNFRNEIFDAAIPAYDSLAQSPLRSRILLRTAHKDVAWQSWDARRFRALHVATMAAQAKGDSLFFLDRYADALEYYREAADSLNQYRLINYRMHAPIGEDSLWRIDPVKIDDKERAIQLRRESTLKNLIDQFTIRQRDAETYMEARVWGQALRNLLAMKALVPAHPEDARRLQEALSLAGLTPDAYVESEIRKCKTALYGR